MRVCGRRSSQRGFTLLELVVVVAAIALLAGVALDRLLPLIGRAQRVAFLQVQGELRSALLLEAADRITRGESAALAELADTNPMTMLLEPPGNYAGSFERPAEDDIPGASWYYDERSRRLVYRVGKHTRFDALDGAPRRIEFRVAFVYRDRNGDSAFDPSQDYFDGLRLEPVRKYEWPD